MFIKTLLLIIGFIILIKGADIFIDGASSIATNFKVSKLLIGLTIVNLGTGAPELAIGFKSVLSGNGDIVLGNVIGSNILNILLIIGLSSLVRSLTVRSSTVKKELPIALLITILFSLLISDNLFNPSAINSFTRREGIILLLFFSIFIYYLFTMYHNKIDEDQEEKGILSNKLSIIYIILGIICIVLGSNLVVDNAALLARKLGITERIIALTIIALGTSLPELVTSLTATKKGEFDIAIGNIVGSNIYNIGIVLGLPVALFGSITNITFNYVDVTVMILSAILLYMFSFNDYKISKKEGIVFLILFVCYYAYIIFA